MTRKGSNKPDDSLKQGEVKVRSIEELLYEIGKMHDHIEQLEEAGNVLRSREDMYREMVHSANSIILCWDKKGIITFANKFTQSFFGFKQQEIIGQKLLETIVPPEDVSGVNLSAMMKDICAHPEKYVNNENENVKKDGERVWISWTNKPVYDRKGKFIEILSVGNDITRRKKAEDELERLASIDMMTGVLNRRAGLQLLEKTLHLAKRHNYKVSICYIDVNNLKPVNDTYGHKEGDEMIRTVCSILKDSMRISDTICRMGGDEFLVILPKCPLPKALGQWKRFERILKDRNEEKSRPYSLSVSQGFAEYDPVETVPAIHEFVTIADGEMYRRKKEMKAKSGERPR